VACALFLRTPGQSWESTFLQHAMDGPSSRQNGLDTSGGTRKSTGGGVASRGPACIGLLILPTCCDTSFAVRDRGFADRLTRGPLRVIPSPITPTSRHSLERSEGHANVRPTSKSWHTHLASTNMDAGTQGKTCCPLRERSLAGSERVPVAMLVSTLSRTANRVSIQLREPAEHAKSKLSLLVAGGMR